MDSIEVIGKGSLVQHGSFNDRIYLMKLHEEDEGAMVPSLLQMASENKYSKIFCKIPQHAAPEFLAEGFTPEAFIPKFYSGKEDVLFMSKFLASERSVHHAEDQLKTIAPFLKDSEDDFSRSLPKGYAIRVLNSEDVTQITKIYSKVFESYPFPIFDSEYILQTMEENVLYFGVEYHGSLVALASSEMDKKGRNAEMTDFATLPEHAGKKLALHLLKVMEKEMPKHKIATLYTIARLNSIAMNKTFIRSGYGFTGTLVNNTNISGKIESMNVYYKHI